MSLSAKWLNQNYGGVHRIPETSDNQDDCEYQAWIRVFASIVWRVPAANGNFRVLSKSPAVKFQSGLQTFSGHVVAKLVLAEIHPTIRASIPTFCGQQKTAPQQGFDKTYPFLEAGSMSWGDANPRWSPVLKLEARVVATFSETPKGYVEWMNMCTKFVERWF